MSTSQLTLLHKLREVKAKHPNVEAFVSYGPHSGRQAVTLSEFHTLCRRFAFILKEEAGVKPGDYVVTTLPISIETAVVTFGIVLAGAVPVSLDITWKNGKGLLQCLDRLKNNVIIVRNSTDDNVFNFFKSGLKVHEGMKDVGQLSWQSLPHLTKLYLVTRGGDADFLTKLRKAKGEYEYENIHGKMSALMHFTTGTVTDYLKMTEMTHEAAVKYCQSMQCLFIKPFKKFMYINGWFWVIAVPFDILNGTTRLIPDDWVPCENVPKLLYNFIKMEKVRFVDLPPVYLEEIMELWQEEGANREPLFDLLTILGMPITRRCLQRYRSITHTFNLIYGSHECGANHSHIIQSSKVDTFTDFDCGLPIPGVESKVVDENGQPVPLGEKGRLLLKTPGMFIGYPNQPERTAALFNKDGWFVTNDRACYDKDSKHLMVGGRIDSIILHGEYMIYPNWVEEMLTTHPAVEQVISVPVRDEVLFHAVGVCIIKKSGCELTNDDVNRHMENYLFPGKVFIFQAKHLLFFDTFPLRGDGSVDRSRLFDIVHDMKL